MGGISGVLVIMALVAILLYRRRMSRRRVSTPDLQIQPSIVDPFITWTQRRQAISEADINRTISSANKWPTNGRQGISENLNDHSFSGTSQRPSRLLHENDSFS